MDAAGNLYGAGGSSVGEVYELARSGGGWQFISLYEFSGGSDGNGANGVTLDSKGNLYGTTIFGGTGSCPPEGCGVVWKITP